MKSVLDDKARLQHDNTASVSVDIPLSTKQPETRAIRVPSMSSKELNNGKRKRPSSSSHADKPAFTQRNNKAAHFRVEEKRGYSEHIYVTSDGTELLANGKMVHQD